MFFGRSPGSLNPLGPCSLAPNDNDRSVCWYFFILLDGHGSKDGALCPFFPLLVLDHVSATHQLCL